MISEKMKPLVNNNSAIRAMFEEGNRLAALYGRENVYDFSLGNPNVPAPKEVKQALLDVLNEEDSCFVNGYMSNAGYPDTRKAVADSLNRRFGSSKSISARGKSTAFTMAPTTKGAAIESESQASSVRFDCRAPTTLPANRAQKQIVHGSYEKFAASINDVGASPIALMMSLPRRSARTAQKKTIE